MDFILDDEQTEEDMFAKEEPEVTEKIFGVFQKQPFAPTRKNLTGVGGGGVIYRVTMHAMRKGAEM